MARGPFGAFVGGSYPAQSPMAALERSINFYPEVIATRGAKAPMALFPTPGVAAFATSAHTPVRAMYATWNGRCFAICGDRLVEVSSDGTLTTRGTVALTVGTDPAVIVGNGDLGNQLCLVSGGHAYVFALATNTLTDVTSTIESPAPTITQAVMIDGYFVVLDTTSTVYQSALGDGLTWNGLAQQQRSAMPDRWVAIANVGRDLWMLGAETSEVWYDAGNSPGFAFSPYASSVVPFGCVAPWSVKALGSSLCWLTQTAQGHGQVVMATGTSPTLISTPALDDVIANYTTITDAVAEAYDERGHRFYVLTFPTEGATWVYDLTTGVWHERGTWVPDDSAYEAWRPLYTAHAFGVQLIGDRESGTIYTLSAAHQTDVDGAVIRRVRRAPNLSDRNTRTFYSRFELDLEPGLGTGTGDGASPTVTLRYSNNAGKTWATAGDRTADTGAQGEYEKRVFWMRLGSARNRVFEVVMTSPVPWRLCGAYLDIAPGEGT